MKTLEDLTPDVSSKIPEYISSSLEGVFDGGRYNSFDINKAVEAINWNYELCGYKSPMVLVAENPLEAQLLFNFVRCIIKGDSKLDSQLSSQLSSQLRSQLSFQLSPQLYSQLSSQLYSQLDSQLYSQLYSQLRSQLNPLLYSQLYHQLYSKLKSKLYSQLDFQLHSQLHSQLDSQLYSQLRQYNNDYLLTINVYSDAYYSWYEFIRKEFNIKIDASLNEKFQKTFELQRSSGIYSAIFSEAICVVSKYPKKVHRNDNMLMHNTSGPAVEWGCFGEKTRFECMYINGRKMPKWIYNGFTKEEFIKQSNEDTKAGMYEIIESKGEGSMLEFLEAREIDVQSFVHAGGEIEEMRLYVTSERFSEEEDLNGVSPAPLAWLKMHCPSTDQVYLIPTDSSFKNCVDAAKYHRPQYVPTEVEYVWQQRN